MIALLMLVGLPTVAAAGDPLTRLFAPLRSVDVARFYEFNHAWIDFVVFLFLFTAVARYSLGRRLGGREGQLLSIVIGLSLALALSLTQRKLGFSLKSFGPLAAGLVIFLVGLAVFNLIRGLGLGRTGAGSLAFLVTYFLVRATTPNFFSWLETNEQTAWIHLVLVIAVLVSVWRVFRIVWPKRNGAPSAQSRSFDSPADREKFDLIKQDQVELKLMDQGVEGLTNQELADEQKILNELNWAIQIIDSHGHDPAKLWPLADRLASLENQTDHGMKQLARLKSLSRRIEKDDLRSFKQLAGRLKKMSPQERSQMKRQLALAKKKIISEEELVKLEDLIRSQAKSRSKLLKAAVFQLRQNGSEQARALLTKACDLEKGAVAALVEMKRKEEELLRTIKIELGSRRNQK